MPCLDVAAAAAALVQIAAAAAADIAVAAVRVAAVAVVRIAAVAVVRIADIAAVVRSVDIAAVDIAAVAGTVEGCVDIDQAHPVAGTDRTPNPARTVYCAPHALPPPHRCNREL